jgi:hypothetical protein
LPTTVFARLEIVTLRQPDAVLVPPVPPRFERVDGSVPAEPSSGVRCVDSGRPSSVNDSSRR